MHLVQNIHMLSARANVHLHWTLRLNTDKYNLQGPSDRGDMITIVTIVENTFPEFRYLKNAIACTLPYY